MVQDESDAVIVVVCSTSRVGEVIRQVRANGELSATLIKAAASAVEGPSTEPPRPQVDVGSGDSVRATSWLRDRHRLTEMQSLAVVLRFYGWVNAEIAPAMGVETGTVKRHIHDALRRIGAGAGVRLEALFRRTLRDIPPQFIVDPTTLATMPWYQWFTRALRRDIPRADRVPLVDRDVPVRGKELDPVAT